MITDRPAAPARSTALAQPSPSASRAQQDAPSDTFSALLGATAPRPRENTRQDQSQGRRDDAQRADTQRGDTKRADAHRADRSHPQHDAKPAKAADDAKDATKPADDAKDGEETPRLVTASIFALQLASPLPAAPTPAPAPPVNPSDELAAKAAAPALPSITPAQLAALTAQTAAPAAPATDAAPAASAAAPAAPQPGDAPTTPAPGTPGGIPLPGLAGMTPASQADLPKDVPATKPQATAVDAAPAPAPAPDAPVGAPNPNGQQTSPDAQSQSQNPQPQTAAPAPADQVKPVDAPAPAVTTAPIAAQPPVIPIAPNAAPTGLERQVPLYRAAETTGLMIQIAAQRGVTHARLHLKPVELGGIEVRLQTSPQGVSAQLVADSPQAARMLDQARDDLRRQLAENNVTLLSLDVSTSNGDQPNQQPGFNAFAEGFGDARGPGASHRNSRLNGDTGLVEVPAAAETNLVLPNGVLVDVLA